VDHSPSPIAQLNFVRLSQRHQLLGHEMAFSNAASKPAKYHLLTVVVCVAVVDRGSVVDRRVVVSSSCVYFLHTCSSVFFAVVMI
jgi:hypothetical protein